MCGITGIISYGNNKEEYLSKIEIATAALSKRGPDGHGVFVHQHVAIGHRRLSVIDTTDAATQPMFDGSGRYVIVYNGEFFNYKEHRNRLLDHGVLLKNYSDTEVLLNLYILEGEKFLEKVNGFFALAIYDSLEQTLFLARDRFGVKPLIIYEDDEQLIFASEIKALLKFGIKKELNESSLYSYLQLNYIPAPQTIFRNIRKMQAGTCMTIKLKNRVVKNFTSTDLEHQYYKLPIQEPGLLPDFTYDAACERLSRLMHDAVERRLISDVPLGAFLSGGLDSSVIAGLASQYTKHLNTFSIGFKDEPFFDETRYANAVAKMHGTNHTVFNISNNDLFEVLHDVLDYLDEPFADSSALNVFILSRETRKHVTVALSGDGADEIFGGYNKHRAEWLIRNDAAFVRKAKLTSSLLKPFAGSRNSKIGNKIRQVHRFAFGSNLNAADRYWRWCAFVGERDAERLIHLNARQFVNYRQIKEAMLKNINGKSDLNDVFYTDVKLVLENDMLRKVDLMSMANSLEVRTPFIDFNVVDFAFSLPSEFKIDKSNQKKIVKDTFRNILPDEILNRSKQGFEVPLLKWFRTELKSMIADELLNDQFIAEQKIFNLTEIQNLKKELFSRNPGEIHARIWGLIVFQYWWKKYFL